VPTFAERGTELKVDRLCRYQCLEFERGTVEHDKCMAPCVNDYLGRSKIKSKKDSGVLVRRTRDAAIVKRCLFVNCENFLDINRPDLYAPCAESCNFVYDYLPGEDIDIEFPPPVKKIIHTWAGWSPAGIVINKKPYIN
jgi:hypothetical protein